MNDIQKEVELVKRELVELIIEHLKDNKIDVDTSRKLASDFLAVLPISTWVDLLTKLKQLGQKYPEARELYYEELEKEEERKKHIALDQIRDHIQQGQIEEATNVARTLNTERIETI